MSDAGGLSLSRLGAMREILAGYVERGELAGLVALVNRHGTTHVEALGKLALGGEAPMRRDTLFRIASMTKPIAAVGAMILVEECKLRLDEPVDRLLPELADRRVLQRIDGPLDETVAANRPISVRDLLTLRLGIGYTFQDANIPIQQALKERQILQGSPLPQTWPNPDEWMARLADLPLMAQPGERWMYDLGIDILGVLIARAAGKSLPDFLHERIFEPLGMVDTAFSVPAHKIGRLATSYSLQPDSGALKVYDPAVGGEWSKPPAFPAAASGLVSTVDDYLAFGQMLLHHGRHGSERILSRLSVETMTANHLTPQQQAESGFILGDQYGWGFGMSVVTRRDSPYDTLGKFGWTGGLGTAWFSDPKEQMTTILMTQKNWTSPTAANPFVDFWTSVYSAIDD